jgi:hypothetical protein
LSPILDQFVRASSGLVSKEFWRKIYKLNSGPMGTFVSGWIVTLFPYILGYDGKQMQPNFYLKSWDTLAPCIADGVTLGSFPSGFSSTAFTWQYFKDSYEMSLCAGFMGVGQDRQLLSIRPVVGWAVVDKEGEEMAVKKGRYHKHHCTIA